MATKANPGPFDCYAGAAPDEPMFILLGRDPMAGILVRLWAALRDRAGEDPAKVENALWTASQLEQWAIGLGKREKIIAAVEDLKTLSMPSPDIDLSRFAR